MRFTAAVYDTPIAGPPGKWTDCCKAVRKSVA
jgi:hypothetical protein